MNLGGNHWDKVLDHEYHEEYFKKIVAYINRAYKEREIFPPKSRILRALTLTDYDDVKVVILGQDPYHGENEAHGLSFSVLEGVRRPPSLDNIFKELYSDLGIEKDYNNGDLTPWVKQGVMLLNTGLTVEKDKPNSHKNLGWHEFTDVVIQKLNEKNEPVVFILWGNNAREKKKFITNPKHLIIESAHPSPFSAYNGFFGSKPFSRTNEFLKKNNMEEIKW